MFGQELGALGGRIDRIEEAADAVIISGVIEGEGASSGVRVQMLVHPVFMFRAGKVVRRQVFETLAQASTARACRALPERA